MNDDFEDFTSPGADGETNGCHEDSGVPAIPEGSGGYKVGRGRPPLATRFKKGQSGNPSGRPKRQPTQAELVGKVLRARVAVSENGKKRMVPVREVLIRQQVKKAASGDHRAFLWLMEHDLIEEMARVAEDVTYTFTVRLEEDDPRPPWWGKDRDGRIVEVGQEGTSPPGFDHRTRLVSRDRSR